MGFLVVHSERVFWHQRGSLKENQPGSTMCQVTSFFCGCADLRKGALIIGIIKLVLALIQVAYIGWALSALVLVGNRNLGNENFENGNLGNFGNLGNGTFGNLRNGNFGNLFTASLVI